MGGENTVFPIPGRRIGASAVQASTLHRVINRGDHALAPAQFWRWVYAGGRKLGGLVRRRAAEAELYGVTV